MPERVNILIVDDHEENLLALEAILASPAYNLVRAGSGSEALRQVLRRDFALILLDVAMPDLDGYETAELIRGRERSRQTPIIFLTANNRSDAHVFRGYSVGAVDYIFKPFTPEILRSKVAVFVELYQKREALKRQTRALLEAQEDLEDRVRARTRELAAANESLHAEIEERRRIEAERLALLEREQDARTHAEAVNRLKDEFLATLSHELRTPLNAILGWAQLLSTEGATPALIERAVGVIKNNAMAQSQLIEDILDVSRIISGKLRLNLSTLHLREVIEAALDSVSPAADAKAITIERHFMDVQPIAGDRDRLQQVVWNLLSNAVKFTPREGRVVVRLFLDGDDIVLQVQDTGIGIRREFLPYVFDRFSQADGTATRRHGGLGLGMAIVRHLTELHGGTVRADSDGESQGATFTIVLPARLRTQCIQRAAGAEDPSRDRTATSLSGVRILVVDDDPDARGFVCEMLQQQGAIVLAAGSAPEALATFLHTRPDVVVSDIGMPGEDGFSLIRHIRALDPAQGGNTPAIAVTAYVREQDAAAATDAGFHRHVGKPVVAAELIAAVRDLVSSTAAAEQ